MMKLIAALALVNFDQQTPRSFSGMSAIDGLRPRCLRTDMKTPEKNYLFIPGLPAAIVLNVTTP